MPPRFSLNRLLRASKKKTFHQLDDDSISQITPLDYLQSQGISQDEITLLDEESIASTSQYLNEHGISSSDISVMEDIAKKNADHIRFSQKLLLVAVVTPALILEVWLLSITTATWVAPNKVKVPEVVQISMVGGAVTNVFGLCFIVVKYFFKNPSNDNKSE